MGTCQTKDNSKTIDRQVSRANQPLLVFSVKTWPSHHSINFRDVSTCLKRLCSVDLNDGKSQQLQLKSHGSKHQETSLPFLQNQKTLSCSVFRKDEKFQLNFNKQVYRSAVSQIPININDVCLIGRTKYKLCIMEIEISKKQYNEGSVEDQQQNQSAQESEIKCRVCYNSHSAKVNPLISPCQCRGSIQYIHLNCLSIWLFGSVHQDELLFLETRKSHCEICKTNITETDAYRRIIAYILAGSHKIAAPFAVFEGTLSHKRQPDQKNYMVLSFANKTEFKIGRSHSADITDTADRFLSRINSMISYKDSQLWIKDHESKHGTGVALKHPLILSLPNPHESIIYYNSSLDITYSDK